MSTQEGQGKLLPGGSRSRNGGEREVKLMRIWRESESKAKRIFLTYLFLAVNQLNNRRRKTRVSQRLPRSPERKTPSKNTEAAAEQGQDRATGRPAAERRARFQEAQWTLEDSFDKMSSPKHVLAAARAGAHVGRTVSPSLGIWPGFLGDEPQLTLSGITGIPRKSRKRDNFMI